MRQHIPIATAPNQSHLMHIDLFVGDADPGGYVADLPETDDFPGI